MVNCNKNIQTEVENKCNISWQNALSQCSLSYSKQNKTTEFKNNALFTLNVTKTWLSVSNDWNINKGPLSTLHATTVHFFSFGYYSLYNSFFFFFFFFSQLIFLTLVLSNMCISSSLWKGYFKAHFSMVSHLHLKFVLYSLQCSSVNLPSLSFIVIRALLFVFSWCFFLHYLLGFRGWLVWMYQHDSE